MQSPKKSLYSESSAPPSQIEDLYQHTRTFRRIPKGYKAIHLHFSILDRLHKQPQHRRAIATAFNKLLAPYEGKLFWMHNFDLFFISKGCPHTKLDQAKYNALRAVDDSPVLKQIIDNSEDDKICVWYDLASEYDAFYKLVEQLRRNLAEGDEDKNDTVPNLRTLMANLDPDKEKDISPKPRKKKTALEQKAIPQYEHVLPKKVIPTIGPMQLDKLERNILNIDMFSLIDQQNICVVVENMAPQVVFTKKYISLNEMNTSILPGYNISGDKWLFQRLTQTFDHKLMQALINYKSFPENVLSININVSTIFTKEFDKFVAKQKTMSEHPMVLEIALFDIMSDLTLYFKAQEKIYNLGYKICICNMDIQSLYVLNRELINVDFLKVRWNKNYIGDLNKIDRERISSAIKDQGKMRVILSDCSSKEAISFGTELGIVMYQGFEIDQLQRVT